jgi:hypothetical protein
MQGALIERWLRRGALLCLALVGGYLVVSAFEPFRTNWGDPWSDGNAMTSGRYFAQDGFVKTAFTPILDVGPLDQDSLRYTHYPPLPDLVAGAIQKVIGPDHLAVHRLLAILFSALGLWFFHKYLRALWGEAVATLGIVIIATNLLFIQYADTVHHIPLYSMTGFGCLWAALRWLDDRSGRALIAVAVATFFCFLASYDFYFFLTIMILATVRLRGARLLRGHGLALVLVVGASGLASIAVKNLLVIWAVGVEQWHRDIIFQFFERATSAHSRVYKHMLPDVVFWRLWRFGSPLIFAAILVQVIGVIDHVRSRKPLVSVQPLILLVAALPFMFVFSQLVVEQYHPMLLLLPFAGVAIALIVKTAWAGSRPVAIGLMALYLGWQLWALSLFKKTFLAPPDVAAVQALLASDHHRFVRSDIFVDGPVRFLWNRHLYGVNTDPVGLREDFETYGNDSPLTIVLLKRMRTHMFDKGLFAYFAGERQLPWIARPDYYRNAWGQRFDKIDRQLREELADIGHVAYESKELIVRTVTEADLDRLQRSQLPKATTEVIDFETAASDPYKVSGITGRHGGTDKLPGFAWLFVRVPSKLVFTLHGYEYPKIGEPLHTSRLQLRLPPDRGVHLAIDVSSPAPFQIVTIALNGHVLARQGIRGTEGMAGQLGPDQATVVRIGVDVPATALAADGVQALDLDFSYTAVHEALRLHRVEITPLHRVEITPLGSAPSHAE